MSTATPKRVAVIGGGWAGLAAAVRACSDGHAVTVFEASRHWGGRARRLPLTLPNGDTIPADNGQHILIGAYTDTLQLMRHIGLEPSDLFRREPLGLVDPQGQGLQLPQAPAWLRPLAHALSLEVALGMLTARGWSWRDKWHLLQTALKWQLQGFQCAPDTTVAQLCTRLPPRLMQDFIDPLCVSALNTPAAEASGAVFLRVMKDALFGPVGGSDLLLPRVDLGRLFPEAAVAWLQARGAVLHLGQRVAGLAAQKTASGRMAWRVADATPEAEFDAVIWAAYQSNLHLPMDYKEKDAAYFEIYKAIHDWQNHSTALPTRAIATVYTWCEGHTQALLPRAMTALASNAEQPAQFVFDRAYLGGPAGLLAWVVSASEGDSATLERQVIAQAQSQLGLAVQALKTVVEKRATFACIPGLQRPSMHIAPHLWAAGDHISGPYPATLEGAIRNGWAAGGCLGG
ncbi:MAG: hypothetical protein RLZZ612_1230 [Pseudomonadota bacterium]|jgi:squalene-associated FAD-dependent desaturase